MLEQAGKPLLRGARKLTGSIRSRGLWDSVCRAEFLLYEWYRERRLGIETAGFIDWFQLSENPESVDYDPIGYRTLDRALRRVCPDPARDVFLDYGCGKGRPLITAAQRPFARVLGVEKSPALCRAARRNVQRAGRRLKCRQIEIFQASAECFPLPDEVSVVFMFNPFIGRTLDAVVGNMERSLRRCPRPLTLLYVLPVWARDPFSSRDWLRRSDAQDSQGLRLLVYESLIKPESE